MQDHNAHTVWVHKRDRLDGKQEMVMNDCLPYACNMSTVESYSSSALHQEDIWAAREYVHPAATVPVTENIDAMIHIQHTAMVTTLAKQAEVPGNSNILMKLRVSKLDTDKDTPQHTQTRHTHTISMNCICSISYERSGCYSGSSQFFLVFTKTACD